MTGRPSWPAGLRDEIRWRDTPPGMGVPFCAACGEPAPRFEIHHLLPAGRGGETRADNGTVMHPEWAGRGCHILLVHRRGLIAAQAGWLRSRHAARPQVYASPVWITWRKAWLILDAGGGYETADLPPPGLPGEDR